MVTDIVQHLTNDNRELKKLCASAIFKVSKVFPGHFVTVVAFVRFDFLTVITVKIIIYFYAVTFSLLEYC
jgi:hypothetical protein